MALSRIATALGGLLLSKGGRRFAGRHAGKLALATLAFELWQSRRNGARPAGSGGPRPNATETHARQRWSGRSRR
ncbi:cysteine protease [Brevundimonas sp. R86498]|uniref:cysteine protease n=1 Tax=Brevundimonas sp. R86498 TaxID=3093845 RepID=UPI0037CB0197